MERRRRGEGRSPAIHARPTPGEKSTKIGVDRTDRKPSAFVPPNLAGTVSSPSEATDTLSLCFKNQADPPPFAPKGQRELGSSGERKGARPGAGPGRSPPPSAGTPPAGGCTCPRAPSAQTPPPSPCAPHTPRTPACCAAGGCGGGASTKRTRKDSSLVEVRHGEMQPGQIFSQEAILSRMGRGHAITQTLADHPLET